MKNTTRKPVDRDKAVEGVYERSPGKWYVRYRRNGKIVRKSFGANKQEAIAYYRKVKVLIRSGEGFVPDTAKKTPKSNSEMAREEMALQANGISLSELCDDFIAHVKSRPEEYRDQRNPPTRVEAIREAFGRRPAASVRPFEIEQWLDELKLKKAYKPATLNRMKATLSSVYQLGKQRDKVKVNPARDVKQRRVGPGVIRFLKPDEEKRLRAVLNADIKAAQQRPQYQKHMIHRLCELDVALGTGMRKGEQYGLTWRDVDFEQSLIQLRDTKNGHPRAVPMIDDVVAAMRKLRALDLGRKARSEGKANPAPSDSVFGIGDNKKWWSAALTKAKIENFRWHDLRHTFCSRLAQSGASLKIIQEAAGHKTIAMAARYAHMDQSSLRNAMAILNRTA